MEGSRRRVLAGAAGLLTTSALAGCLDEAEEPTGDENGAEGNGTDDTATASVAFLVEGLGGHDDEHDHEDGEEHDDEEHDDENHDDGEHDDHSESIAFFARGGSVNIIEGQVEHADEAENCSQIDEYVVVELDDSHAVVELRAD